jgi:CheY-like chemotaxis protein
MKKPATILLVEDNEADIDLTLDAFREAHLDNHTFVCRGGQEALDYLYGSGKYANRLEYPLPDFVLLDLKMPGIDGHEVLLRVKKTDSLKRIPIIILTSSTEEGDRALSYDNGANSYLVKPVTFEGFIDVAKQLGEYWLTLNVDPPIDD